MKEKIARWYKQSLWTAAMVQDAIDRGIITTLEGLEILGQKGE